MRRSIATTCLLVCSAVFANAADVNKLSAQESKAGWKLLFDGKSLNGWQARASSAPGSTGDFTVADGAILCPGTSPGWLASSQKFGDFDLKLEFRGAGTVNSGIFIRSEIEGQPHITGYEVQIWDTQPAGFNTGSLVQSVKAEPTKIVGGQWNTYEIKAEGDHFVTILNGKTLLDGKDSKHLNAGVIGLQCQKDNKIEFRNIRVLPLTK